MKTLTNLLLAAILSFSGSVMADEAADRAAIEDLMWRYARALDSLDAQAYAAVFTEDGQFGTGENATRGHEALIGLIEGVRSGRQEREATGAPPSPDMFHMIVNHTIEFIDSENAVYHSYWMTVFGPTEAGETPSIAAVGRGQDELVKIDGEWLIRIRNVSPE